MKIKTSVCECECECVREYAYVYINYLYKQWDVSVLGCRRCRCRRRHYCCRCSSHQFQYLTMEPKTTFNEFSRRYDACVAVVVVAFFSLSFRVVSFYFPCTLYCFVLFNFVLFRGKNCQAECNAFEIGQHRRGTHTHRSASETEV